MDKLSVISGALFLAADVFAIASLCMPNWIVSTVSGKNLDLLPAFTWIHPGSQPAAMDGHQRGKNPMLEAPPSRSSIRWYTLAPTQFTALLQKLQFPGNYLKTLERILTI